MADERRVSLPHRRASAHEFYAVGKRGEHLFGMLLRADFADGAVLVGEGGDGGEGTGPAMMTWPRVTSKKRATSCNVFAALISLPRQPAIEPELRLLGDGAT